MALPGRVRTIILTAALVAACGSGKVVGGTSFVDSDGGTDGGPIFLPDGGVIVEGAGVGEACSDVLPCRAGLTCTNSVCEPGHTTAEGDACLIAGECQDGLQCIAGQCAPDGDGALGDACTSDGGCQSGLRCGVVGFGAQCVAEGTVDLDGSCAQSSECFGGLMCTPESQCVPAIGGISLGLPASPTIQCAEAAQTDIAAHFEVPGAADADPDADFFRLPFPNDIRVENGRLNLDGFPTPGVSPLVGFDPVQVYLDAVTATETGWGTYPSALFRFSGPVDFNSLRARDEGPIHIEPVLWIDITDPVATKNDGLVWSASSGGSAYICDNWVGVRRHEGSPLEPNRTYAVYITTDARDANGQPVKRDPHFTAVLSDVPPADPALAAAHVKYAPFRAYLAAQTIEPATILVAAVFTTSNPRALMADLANAAAATPVPAASNWVRCDGSAVSPCPQAEGERACGPVDAQYDEYHALVTLPIFQRGEAPYLTSGGDIDTTAPIRTEQVCVSLTVPKSPMPASGWPLAVYGHGTGGSFRDSVRAEVAGALAQGAIPGGSAPMAVLGYDAVQHGPRRGSSTDSPENLFFNFRNPAAARGNPLQGAADVISIGRFAAALDATAAETGGDAIRIDPARIAYFGHSQGSMHGSLGLPYSNVYRAAVLSGNGASLMHALLEKTSPVNIAAAVPLVLGDFDNQRRLKGGENHPVLTLLQHWIDPADPLNFATLIASQPVTGVVPKHVFQTYGLGDSYSPPKTMRIYALAAGLSLVDADPSAAMPDEVGLLMPQPAPFSNNLVVDGVNLTTALRQYGPPSGVDGHFVVFDVPSANADAVRFLAMAASGDIPQVGQ